MPLTAYRADRPALMCMEKQRFAPALDPKVLAYPSVIPDSFRHPSCGTGSAPLWTPLFRKYNANIAISGTILYDLRDPFHFTYRLDAIRFDLCLVQCTDLVRS